MQFDYTWFKQAFSTILEAYTIEEKVFPKAQFGYANSLEFELAGKIIGYITIYKSGVLEIIVSTIDYEVLLNIFIVRQDDNTHKEKEAAFQDFKTLLTQYTQAK